MNMLDLPGLFPNKQAKGSGMQPAAGKRRGMCFLLLAMFFAASPAFAAVITLTNTNAQDTYTDSRSSSEAQGGRKWLYLGHGDGARSTALDTYIQFDLTGMPAEASSATLNLYYYGGNGTLSTPIYAYVVTGTWSESTLVYDNRPTNNATSFASFAVTSTTPAYYSLDITSVYNQWSAGTLTNFGIVLKSDPVNGETFGFRSTESANQPYVDVTAVPEPGTWGMTMAAGAVLGAIMLRRRLRV